MTHYRILTNGEKFRVQTWNWFFPFWMYVKKYYGDGSFNEITEWKTREDAELWVADRQAEDAYYEKKWRAL